MRTHQRPSGAPAPTYIIPVPPTPMTDAEQIALLREHLNNPDVYDTNKYDQRFTWMLGRYLGILEKEGQYC
jgi:hypothetical protein